MQNEFAKFASRAKCQIFGISEVPPIFAARQISASRMGMPNFIWTNQENIDHIEYIENLEHQENIEPVFIHYTIFLFKNLNNQNFAYNLWKLNQNEVNLHSVTVLLGLFIRKAILKNREQSISLIMPIISVLGAWQHSKILSVAIKFKDKNQLHSCFPVWSLPNSTVSEPKYLPYSLYRISYRQSAIWLFVCRSMDSEYLVFCDKRPKAIIIRNNKILSVWKYTRIKAFATNKE